MFRYLFLAAFVLLVAGLVWLCDFGFKHLLWRFVAPRTAVVLRWTAALLIWSGISVALWYGHRYGRFALDLREVSIRSPRVPQAFEGYRIAQISDLHLASFDSPEGHAFLLSAFDSLLAQKPDLIVFTGDLVTYEAQEANRFRNELTHLAAQGIPVLSIMGNHDYADYTTMTPRQRLADRALLRRIQAECGWQLLDNTTLPIARQGDTLHVVGVENIGEPPFATYGSLRQAMGGDLDAAASHFTILLSHNPSHWRQEVVGQTHIDLTLSGHTHAMQLRVWGWSPAAWKYKEWGGLYQEGAQQLYVNTGLGCTGPAMRLGVGPEITFFTLMRP